MKEDCETELKDQMLVILQPYLWIKSTLKLVFLCNSYHFHKFRNTDHKKEAQVVWTILNV